MASGGNLWMSSTPPVEGETQRHSPEHSSMTVDPVQHTSQSPEDLYVNHIFCCLCQTTFSSDLFNTHPAKHANCDLYCPYCSIPTKHRGLKALCQHTNDSHKNIVDTHLHCILCNKFYPTDIVTHIYENHWNLEVAAIHCATLSITLSPELTPLPDNQMAPNALALRRATSSPLLHLPQHSGLKESIHAPCVTDPSQMETSAPSSPLSSIASFAQLLPTTPTYTLSPFDSNKGMEGYNLYLLGYTPDPNYTQAQIDMDNLLIFQQVNQHSLLLLNIVKAALKDYTTIQAVYITNLYSLLFTLTGKMSGYSDTLLQLAKSLEGENLTLLRSTLAKVF
ncbi:uncharacterized protein FOMMEDRAFT_25489 [Fomitiporia mediterranea MF3/22]|uniref:uncharacterized protein n=1 Tax=Fomitiporia mediterranea (strain MF3/22) TaxID=694068 RepID=UPI0004408C80|nr:uncharacterized protein FOMMEDRAFT_25489 [Fomitiporia mediterranea MF3/22]EJD08408.1 hypothetical protein FOMMEDRAFT_25489 [Fomitiporia mediterranea MF3/22]